MEAVRGILQEGGPVMIAIAAASVAAWVMIIGKWTHLRWDVEGASAVLEAARAAEWERAEARAAQYDNGLARVLAAGLAARRTGRREFRMLLGRMAQAERKRLRRWLAPLGALAALLPLLGLLGTVLGMLTTFRVIQIHGTGDPLLMADGIGQALLTTQAGLFAALPILLLEGFLSSKAERLGGELELQVHRMEAVLFEESV